MKRILRLLGLIVLLSSGAFAQISNPAFLWRPQPNPAPPPCPRIRQFYNLSGTFQQIDCNGVITTISNNSSLPDPGANGFVVRTAPNTVTARTLQGTVNRIVLTNPNGVGGDPTIDIGSTVATSGANLSFFAATTSVQLAGVISDESGSGSLIFNSSPTIVTPTIASFANATHNHESAAGGGQLNASNVFSAGAVSLARGGTGASLADPNAHRLLGWDDTNGDVRFFVIGSGLAYDAGTDTLSVTVSGLGDPGANGIVARTALNTTVARTLQQPAAGLQITNPNGVGGDPNFLLANDLAAVEGLGSTGFAVRSAADTWATRTITGTAGQITVVDGSGASGNPTLSLPTIVFLGTPGGSPAAGTLKGPDASGTNITGAPLELAGGPGTGNAVPGAVAVRYPLITTSGTTLQSLSANAYPVHTSLYTNTAQGAPINNTITETSLFAALTPSSGSTTSIEAGSTRIGTNYKVRIVGNVTTSGSPTIRIRGKLGSTVIVDTTAATISTGAGKFWLDLDVQIAGIGALGNVITFLRFDYSSVDTGAGTVSTINSASGGTGLDLTVAQALDVTIQWGTANPANSIFVFIANITRQR